MRFLLVSEGVGDTGVVGVGVSGDGGTKVLAVDGVGGAKV